MIVVVVVVVVAVPSIRVDHRSFDRRFTPPQQRSKHGCVRAHAFVETGGPSWCAGHATLRDDDDDDGYHVRLIVCWFPHHTVRAHAVRTGQPNQPTTQDFPVAETPESVLHVLAEQERAFFVPVPAPPLDEDVIAAVREFASFVCACEGSFIRLSTHPPIHPSAHPPIRPSASICCAADEAKRALRA